MKMIAEVPTIRAVQTKRGRQGKGRAIIVEEFERMLAKVPDIVGEVATPSWHWYLEGLWWSGLRLVESLALYWDRYDRLCVDLSGNRPMLSIPAELEKGGRDRLLPIAPEFAELLEQVSVEERTGRVFSPMRRQGEGTLKSQAVGNTISDIGEAANVKVWTHPITGKVKTASTHDLRRSFGFRRASRVMPKDLMELMRHEKIETTIQFCVGRNAEATADAVWAAYEAVQTGNTLGNTRPKNAENLA